MSNLSGNYLHIRKDSNKVFYGGMGNFIRAKDKRNRTDEWKKIQNECGVEIKYLGDRSSEEALALEKSLIKIFGRKDLGNGILINKNNGGLGGYLKTENERKKISVGNAARYKKPEEREKTSKACKGIKRSIEFKEKMSLIAKARHAEAKALGLNHNFKKIIENKNG